MSAEEVGAPSRETIVAIAAALLLRECPSGGPFGQVRYVKVDRATLPELLSEEDEDG